MSDGPSTPREFETLQRRAETRRRAKRTADALLARATYPDWEDTAEADEIVSGFERLGRMFAEACEDLRGGIRVLGWLTAGALAAVRRATFRARSTVEASSAGLVASSFAAAGNVLVAATLAASILAPSAVSFAGPAPSETPMPAGGLSQVSAAHPASSFETHQLQARAKNASGWDLDTKAGSGSGPLGTSAKGHVGKNERRIDVGALIAPWNPVRDDDLSAAIIIDCDPRSQVATTLCSIIDLMPPPPADQ